MPSGMWEHFFFDGVEKNCDQSVSNSFTNVMVHGGMNNINWTELRNYDGSVMHCVAFGYSI